MASWTFGLDLDDTLDTPVFLQIARAILEAIQARRLVPEERLPGTRTLAATLGVHRNTVVAAYDELVAEGWIESAPARGMFVAKDLPLSRARRATTGLARRAGFDLRPPPTRRRPQDPPNDRRTIVLAGGAPDLEHVPKAALARAYRRALFAKRVLDYGDPRGEPALREQLAAMLAEERGIVATPEEILVVRGSQMGLRLIADAIVGPKDRVVVEALGYPPAWVALGRGRLEPIPVDQEGLDVDALAALVQRHPIRAVYVTPHHQYPTLVVLSAARRLALLDLARRHRFAIVEDDYDNEVHYRGRPVLPLASQDHAGVVVYVGTLSKVLAPGLRLGYVVAPAPLIERLAEHRRYIDRQGDRVVERALAELMEDGEVQRHARRMRRLYGQRREAFLELLDRHLSGVLRVESHDGGMALWAHAPGVDVDRWAADAEANGVWFATARRFTFDGRPRPYLRLGFAAADERTLARAVRRMTEVVP